MIYVIATVEVKPGKREAFLAEFHRNIPTVRAEKGCIEYGPAVDLKTEIKAQIPIRENVVTAVEKRESLQALQGVTLNLNCRATGRLRNLGGARECLGNNLTCNAGSPPPYATTCSWGRWR